MLLAPKQIKKEVWRNQEASPAVARRFLSGENDKKIERREKFMKFALYLKYLYKPYTHAFKRTGNTAPP
jgi:hypothetical protein